MRKLLIIFIIGWLATFLKHFWILPTVGEDRDISGFEFRIKF
jgi:hypothetical protein